MGFSWRTLILIVVVLMALVFVGYFMLNDESDTNDPGGPNPDQDALTEAQELCIELEGTWHDGETSCVPCPEGQFCVTVCQEGCET